jgi:uncharacterized SAM-binding protein YcdF (DUF218 family)
MKVICILFHVGKKKNRLSEDSKLRLLAGSELAKENEEALVLFVGGYGLEISGAEMMKNYWKENFSEIRNEYFIMNYSNNTFDNIEEIRKFIIKKNIPYPGIDIISSMYHAKRLKEISNRLGIKAVIISAEELLISKNKKIEELTRYMDSAGYKKKIFLEKMLHFYSILDPRQRLVNLWRRISYGR